MAHAQIQNVCCDQYMDRSRERAMYATSIESFDEHGRNAP